MSNKCPRRYMVLSSARPSQAIMSGCRIAVRLEMRQHVDDRGHARPDGLLHAMGNLVTLADGHQRIDLDVQVHPDGVEVTASAHAMHVPHAVHGEREILDTLQRRARHLNTYNFSHASAVLRAAKKW